jgi:hypothetical protein
MRPVPLLILLAILLPSISGADHGNGNDSSSAASDNASCNASFQEDCVDDHADETSSSSVAAPIGDWADSTQETLALLVMILAVLHMKTRRKTLNTAPAQQGVRARIRPSAPSASR